MDPLGKLYENSMAKYWGRRRAGETESVVIRKVLVSGYPRTFNVVPFGIVLIRVLTQKPYKAQKGTTLEGLQITQYNPNIL